MSLVEEIIEQQHATDDPAKYAACLLRLAGHDFMDYRNKGGVETGGSDGCINFNDPDNTGLPGCMKWTGIKDIYDSQTKPG